ncbi:MAG: hypothetical protein ACYSTF_03245 [Planctomycetota bacterium]|jgi:hypothetical protein
MKCKLCHLDKKLCQSHIVPESAYGSLYDNKHRFYEVSNVQKKLPILQKGLRESLLCKGCEQHLNKYESYFADTWFQNQLIPTHVSKEISTIGGLDYKRFKLFHMSILWRAGITSRKEFVNVNLSNHEERLRQLVLDDDPGDPNQYSVFGYILVFPSDRVCNSLLIQPVEVDLFNVPGFHVTFGGCVWHYLLSDNIDLNQFPFILKDDGNLHMFRIEVDQYDPVMDLMRERINQGWKSSN